MLLKSIILLSCLLYVRTVKVPSWEQIQQKLHEKIEELTQNDKAEVYKKIIAGKFFKYYINNEIGSYRAVEDGTDSLPHWLTFDGTKKKLQGIPTESDVRKVLKIVFIRTDNNDKRDTKRLTLDIVKNPEPFRCKDATTVASVIFHADLKSMEPDNLVKFMREFSKKFDTSINDLHIESGNRMESNGLLSSYIRMAGPGESGLSGNQPGFTVSWKLKCGTDIAGNADIATLRSYSQKENFSELHKPVLGWFVTSTRSNRNRRAAAVSGTPGATPTLSVRGTPTLVPSASVAVKMTGKVSATPSKTTPMVKTSVVMPTTLKPVIVTTEEPTTTTTTTTTETPVPTTKKTTKKMIPTTPFVNKPPVVDKGEGNKFSSINAQEHAALEYRVPITLFTDDEPLTITLLYKRSEYLPNVPSWIMYKDLENDNNPARALYMLPGKKQVGEHHFALKAEDAGGLSVNHFFSIYVKRDTLNYNFKFNATLEMDFNEIAKNAEKKVKLVKRLSKLLYDDESKYQRLKNIKFLNGSVIVRWGDEELSNKSCNDPELVSYREMLNGNEFKDRMAPEYTVTKTGMTSERDCPLVIVSDVSEEDESLWERILIPVIVIVIIFLIIALILCCVYRRKRKYEPQSDQDETYLNHKKPVIFLEEYDEKPDFVSLQPLILPNEKPPVQDQAYGRSSPDGPGESSTTVSTESDENAPLAPKSPKERTGYNAPPPYSAR